MARRYLMADGTLVDVDNATRSFDENTRWDGSNNVSVATGSQWRHERLHRSRRGRFWLERWSDVQREGAGAEWLSDRQAVAWLLANEDADRPWSWDDDKDGLLAVAPLRDEVME